MIVSSIDAHAQARSSQPAVRFEDKVFTFGELAREIDRTVYLLKKAGVSASGTVAVFCENRPEIMLLYYAMAKIGGTFVPLNAALSSQEVRYILEHAGTRVLFTDARLGEVARDAISGTEVDLLLVDEFFARDMTTAPRYEQNQAPTEDFLIIYTSGSTGTPKAVLYSQESEVAGNASLIEMWQMGPDDKLLVALPLGFLYGLSTSCSMALQAGSEIIIQRRFHPRETLEAIVEHRVTAFQGVPTMFSMMLEYAEQNDLHFDLSHMRVIISAGAPLSDDLRSRFAQRFGKELEDYYALTEARPIFGKYYAEGERVPHGAIGKAAPGARIIVVDSNGAAVAAGVTGEIWVRAAATTHGYFKNPELTQATFQDGLLRTGDLGHVDADGYFYLTGRIKDIIIRGGANIAPAEVENALLAHPAVLAAAVIGIPDSKFGELPLAYIVLAPGQNPDDTELEAFASQRLAQFKLPCEYRRIDEMPLGNTGKIDKKALKTLWESGNQ